MRRLNNPRSEAENVRPIVRKQYRFDDGMRMTPDCEGLDVGDGTSNSRALAWLNNCRGYKTNIEGDPGTVRFVAAKFSVLITAATESSATALSEGELFAANGDAELEDETIFEVLGVGDFTDELLTNSKQLPVRPRDHFKYRVVEDGLNPFEYLGNCRIPPLPGFGAGPTEEISATKSGDRITRTDGPLFTAALAGCFFVWSYDVQDLILEVIDEDTVRVSNAETSKTGTMCRIEPNVYASHMHRSRQMWVILAGTRLYLSVGIPSAGWTEIPVCADLLPSATMSVIKEDGDNLILMNASGWYRILLDSAVWAYRLNENGPDKSAGDVHVETAVAKHRVIFTASLILGPDSLIKKRVDVKDVVLSHESAPVTRDESTDRDYSVTEVVADSEYIPAPGCFYPLYSRHYTHYSFYVTLNVDAIGIDQGNKESQYIYATDIPAAKGMVCSIDEDGVLSAIAGYLTDDDTGDTLYIAGHGQYSIRNIMDIAGHSMATLYDDEGVAYSGDPIPLAFTGIGGSDILRGDIVNNVLSLRGGRNFTEYDVGKFVFGPREAYPIKRLISAISVELVWSNDCYDHAFVIDPSSRSPSIFISDTLLKSRREAAVAEAAEYYLQNRFYKPLPNCSAFTMESGWMIGARSGDHTYYYCDLARSQHVGFYKETKQYNDKIVAAITQIVGYSGFVYVRTRNSTHRINLSVPVETGDVTSGEQCTMLPDPVEIDPIIGVITQFDSVRFPRGGEVVLTSEPAVRFFDGESYGEPYDTDRINKAMIRKFKRPVVMNYISRRGLVIWGRRDNA